MKATTRLLLSLLRLFFRSLSLSLSLSLIDVPQSAETRQVPLGVYPVPDRAVSKRLDRKLRPIEVTSDAMRPRKLGGESKKRHSIE